MPVISLNGVETGADDFNNLVVAVGNEGSEGRADAFLIIGNEHAHECFWRTFRASAPIIPQKIYCCSGARLPLLLEIRQEPGKQPNKW